MTASRKRWALALILTAVLALIVFKDRVSREEISEWISSSEEGGPPSDLQRGGEESNRKSLPSPEGVPRASFAVVSGSEKMEATEVTSTGVEILIVDEDSREPILGATVSVQDLQTKAEEIFPESNSERKVSLALNSGHYLIKAAHPEYSSDSLMIGADAQTPSIRRTMELTRGHLVTGIVQNQDGQGVSDALVFFKCTTCPAERGGFGKTKTGPEGLFEVKVRGGVYTAEATSVRL